MLHNIDYSLEIKRVFSEDGFKIYGELGEDPLYKPDNGDFAVLTPNPIQNVGGTALTLANS
jgi:hypothetical protein